MLRFSCSQIGGLMGYPDRDSLPAGAYNLIYEKAKQIYLHYSTWNKISGMKEIKKGLECEEDSIALLSELHGRQYVKNSDRISTDLLSGEWDIYCQYQKKVFDIKTSWSKDTHPAIVKESDYKLYQWQLIAYMHLLKEKKYEIEKAGLAFCLVDTPPELIPPWEPVDWHLVSDIDPKFRVSEFEILYDPVKEGQLLRRVSLAQKVLKEVFDEKGFDYKLLEVNF